MKVQLVLKEKNLDFETVEVPREKESRGDLIRLSGQLLVPVLADGTTLICDSTRIVNYLEENY
ncbi:MAG: glutathione S-transferase N-terminal domain-containing protein [Thermodesulfobacteriota bacterium]